MKKFKIWCQTKAIRDAVLKRMDEDGITWVADGNKASEMTFEFPETEIGLFVKNKMLSWGDDIEKFKNDDAPEILVCKYINSVTQMTKSDLKDFMVVETRDGRKFMVAGDFIISQHTNFNLDFYNENLMIESSMEATNLDIMKVYEKKKFFQLIDDDMELLWERQEPKEMTLAEIEAALGYPVKIVRTK